jgi:hypothetical protein
MSDHGVAPFDPAVIFLPERRRGCCYSTDTHSRTDTGHGDMEINVEVLRARADTDRRDSNSGNSREAECPLRVAVP